MSTETPQDRVRASILLTVLPIIAERILQYDKANPAYTLADLRSDDERAIYHAAAEELLIEGHADRVMRFNVLRSHTHALAEKEQGDVDWQARQDVIKFGTPCRGGFGVVRPGACYACHEPVITNKVTLMVTGNLHAEAHGLCCAKDDQRFERIDDFVYRVKGGL